MRNRHLLPGGNTPVAELPLTANRPSAAAWRRCGGPCRALAAVLLLWASGCQCCCCLTNGYSRIIDCKADHPLLWEWAYCPKLDLTRINRPGGIQCCRCCCPPQQCCSGGVYAHRWNSPPFASGTAAVGLQGAPAYPADQPGPYFPPVAPDVAPPAADGSPVPLFEQPQPAPMPAPATAPQSASPPGDVPVGDSGVVRMNYLAPAAESAPAWQIPVEVLFGQ